MVHPPNRVLISPIAIPCYTYVWIATLYLCLDLTIIPMSELKIYTYLSWKFIPFCGFQYYIIFLFFSLFFFIFIFFILFIFYIFFYFLFLFYFFYFYFFYMGRQKIYTILWLSILYHFLIFFKFFLFFFIFIF